MGKPAARITDMHVCPMVNGVVPHVGGPVMGPGVPTVLIGGMPAAVMGDICTCTGPPDTIILGSTGVLIGGKPAARMGDSCSHGGTIVLGCMTVLIGETMPGAVAANPSVAMPEVSAPAQMAMALKSAAANGAVFAQQPAPPEKEPPEKIEKGNVGFTLTDQQGNPVDGEQYELTLPDGSTRKGKTDSNGKVLLQGIDQGNCKLSFPDLHGDEWS
jgi:uncharacterized Zn-binding protein involved in type VI secretion